MSKRKKLTKEEREKALDAVLGLLEANEADDNSYKLIPPKRKFSIWARFKQIGRGKPLPYPTEEKP